jgi:hypothetical protein
MSYLEEIQKLRKRVSDAVEKGVVNNSGREFLEATLIQIMNDAEKNRQNCVQQAENLRRQASIMDGQAGAFASVSSIVYSVINGFVVLAEKEEEERKLVEEEKKAAESDVTPVVEAEPEAKRKTKKK